MVAVIYFSERRERMMKDLYSHYEIPLLFFFQKKKTKRFLNAFGIILDARFIILLMEYHL